MKIMKAVGLLKYLPIENPESLIDATIERPVASGRHMVVKVLSVGVNPVDTKMRSPKEKIEPKLKVLGWDASGIVESLGAECSLFKVGDEVFYSGSVFSAGSNSEYNLIDERVVAKKPKTIDHSEASSFPLVSLTAYEGLFDRMKISENGKDAGKSILIIGGAGGVGSIAIQLAKKIAGMKVIATASRGETIKWCKDMGADFTIDHSKDMPAQLKELGFESVDYIFCLNNTDKYFNVMSEMIAPEGHIASIVELKNAVELGRLMMKSASFSYVFMTTRLMFNTKTVIRQHEILAKIAELIDSKILTKIVTVKFEKINAENLRKAHKILESGTSIGKITLSNW